MLHKPRETVAFYYADKVEVVVSPILGCGLRVQSEGALEFQLRRRDHFGQGVFFETSLTIEFPREQLPQFCSGNLGVREQVFLHTHRIANDQPATCVQGIDRAILRHPVGPGVHFSAVQKQVAIVCQRERRHFETTRRADFERPSRQNPLQLVVDPGMLN